MEDVYRFEGARAASGEVEKILRGHDLEVFATALESVFPRPPGGYPSLEEVERNRPRPRGEVSRLIREERDAREDRVLGLKRRRKAIPDGEGH